VNFCQKHRIIHPSRLYFVCKAHSPFSTIHHTYKNVPRQHRKLIGTVCGSAVWCVRIVRVCDPLVRWYYFLSLPHMHAHTAIWKRRNTQDENRRRRKHTYRRWINLFAPYLRNAAARSQHQFSYLSSYTRVKVRDEFIAWLLFHSVNSARNLWREHGAHCWYTTCNLQPPFI